MADPAIAKDTFLEVTHTEAAQAMIISTEVATTDISAFSGNDHKSIAIHFHMQNPSIECSNHEATSEGGNCSCHIGQCRD